MTNEIHTLIQKREKYLRLSRDEPFNSKIQKQFSKFRNVVADKIKEAKVEFYKNKFETVKSNTNEKWRFINTILNRDKKTDESPSYLEVNGSKISSEKDMADCFNNFFTGIGSGLASKLPESKTNPLSFLEYSCDGPCFDFLEVSNEITAEVIKSSNIKKATGYDGISMRLIKDNMLTLSPVITHMINLVVRTSRFPDSQKIARVRPLHKKGEKSNPNNYRPISILTSLSKITEKVLATQLRFYLENNDILIDSQYGFREKRSTSLAISKLMEQLYSNFNDSQITQGIFLDFSKAFDTIDHQILIEKLPFYNFTNSACNLLHSYLSNRKQFVKLSNHTSFQRDVSIGVPQGSVLGPILFLIFINDLVKAAPMFNYILFADDTNIFSKDPLLLKTNLKNIEEWCIANRLILNYTKTFQVVFKAPNKQITNPEDFKLELGNQELETKNYTKFLGIQLDSQILFREHVSEVCRKLNFVLLLMRCIRPYLDNDTMINIYYTFFYPHLIYGIEFYGHAAKCHLNQILILQKAAVRIILKIRPRSHVSSNFKTLQIMPIDMLFKYRFLLLFENCFSRGSLQLNRPTYNKTRSKDQFVPQRANNCRGERSLLTTGVNLWNTYLQGEEPGGPVSLRDRLVSALWACCA